MYGQYLMDPTHLFTGLHNCEMQLFYVLELSRFQSEWKIHLSYLAFLIFI